MMRQVEDFEQRHFPHDRASAVVFRGELLSRYYFDELWLLPAFVQESLIDDSEWKVFVEHNCGLVVQREGLRWRSSTPDCWTLDFEFTEPALHGWDNTVRLNGQRLLANWTQVLAWFRNWQAQASFTFHTVDTVPDWLLRAVEKEQGSLG